MNELSVIQQLQQEIRDSSVDIKAEVQLLQAFAKGLTEEQFLTNFNNGFRREYSKDISQSELKEDANYNPYLELQVSRSGIYDQLPEGLFFPGSSNKRPTVADLAADYRQNKKKEAAIRKFFQPIDHEFFLQRLRVEEAENDLLEGLQSGILNEYFMRFWELPGDLPRNLAAPFILLIPYAYKIAGDSRLMAECLEYILKEKVRVSITDIDEQRHVATAEGSVLGEAVVGLDLVAGITFYENIPVYRIGIGPLQQSAIAEYLEGAGRSILMQAFERFFVPADAEVIIDILVDRSDRTMQLQKDNGPVLGYSSYLEIQ